MKLDKKTIIKIIGGAALFLAAYFTKEPVKELLCAQPLPPVPPAVVTAPAPAPAPAAKAAPPPAVNK